MMKKELTAGIFAAVCRILLGSVFVFSGFVKAIDPAGFTLKLSEYLTAFGAAPLFRAFAGLAAFCLIALEFTLGVCLLLGVYRRCIALLTAAFMCIMTPLTLYLALFNPVSDCGCFGDALVIGNWATFGKNVVLSVAAVVALIYCRTLPPFFTCKVRWFIPLFASVYCTGFAYWNYNHLPLIDFRPYKTGTNIAEQTAIPEGAVQDEYNYAFVYEKDGIRKEFTLDNYPAADSSWAFVETKTTLAKKGYTPPIASFHIYNRDGDEVTDLILGNKGDMFLLIAAQTETASDKRIDDINSLYEYASEHNIPFYCLTGSSLKAFERWAYITGAEYPCLFADDVLLKTIIRSNPGLVWMRNGTIMMKWHNNDFPGEDAIAGILSLPAEELQQYGGGKRWMFANLFAFTFPLLLVRLYDYVRFGRKTA